MEQNQYSNSLLGNVFKHVFYNIIVYYAFVLPVDLWKKSVVRLNDQRTQGKLSVKNSSSRWPFLSFIKTFLFEFAIDATIFLSYFIGTLVVLFLAFQAASGYGGPGAALMTLIGGLIYVLNIPTALTLYRELLLIAILPIKKFILWCEKPPQHLDIDMRNK